MLLLLLIPIWVMQQGAVTAEPYLEANLRATTDIGADLVETITNGTSYPVVGRSEFFPWLLLGDPATGEPYGWVFQDLVLVTGDLNTVPFSTVVINNPPPAPPTLLPSSTAPAVAAASTDMPLVGVAVAALPTATPGIAVTQAPPTPTIPSGIVGRVSGEVNIRFGPGVGYDRIGVARAGDMFEVTAYHTSVPWAQIRYDDVAGGFGWVAIDLLEIDGNIFTLPSISRLDFAPPTLTPTPNAVVAVSGVPGIDEVSLSPEFQALGDDLWRRVLEAGFVPETSQQGSLFLMDLQTGEAIAFGETIAYSGMSLSKIGILAATYRSLDNLPNGEQARHLANMMVCSENTSSNALLAEVGGDPYSGASEVTGMFQGLGLDSTFMVAPFLIDSRITPQPVLAPQSPADQARANPDPFNQMTVSEMGGLLSSIHQCAVDGTGPLIDTYGADFTQNECQSMLYLMRGNKIGRLLEAAVPEGIGVAHKHGWVGDTHGDAGIVFSPGGDYVLVMVLHGPAFLNFEVTFPLMEDIALTVYNYFNPDEPLAAPFQREVPEICDLNNAEGSQIIDNLVRGRTE